MRGSLHTPSLLLGVLTAGAVILGLTLLAGHARPKCPNTAAALIDDAVAGGALAHATSSASGPAASGQADALLAALAMRRSVIHHNTERDEKLAEEAARLSRRQTADDPNAPIVFPEYPEVPPHGYPKPKDEALDDLRKRPNHEHIEYFKTQPLLKPKEKWVEQTYSRPYERKEREKHCAASEAATRLNAEAVHLAREAFDDPVVFSPALGHAKTLFAAAARLDPECVSAKLNLAMLETAESCHELELDPFGKWAELETRLADMGRIPEAQAFAKYWWWRSIVTELVDNTTHRSREFYHKALQLDPELEEEHIHRQHRYHQGILRAKQTEAEFYLRKAFVQWLTYYEFAPYFGGYPKVTFEDTQRFARDFYISIPNAMSNYATTVLQRVYRYIMDAGMLAHTARPDTAAHESAGDCMNTWMNVRNREFVEHLSGVPVNATYGFTAGYTSGNYLRPHTDISLCEFTLSFLVTAHPTAAYCPIFVQSEPWPINNTWVGRYEDNTYLKHKAVNIHRQVGAWNVIRGRAVPHWTPPLAPHVECTTLLSHFVPRGKHTTRALRGQRHGETTEADGSSD